MFLICPECNSENEVNKDICTACGALLEQAENKIPLEPGVILEERYEINSLVHTDDRGAVYRATDTKLEGTWAINEIFPPLLTEEERNKLDEWMKKTLNNLASLEHPSLPKIIDYFTNNERYYFVRTFVEGESIENIGKKEDITFFSQKMIDNIANQVLSVMDYINSQSNPVLFRDINTAHIILRQDENIVLVNFGIKEAIYNKTFLLEKKDSPESKKSGSGFAPELIGFFKDLLSDTLETIPFMKKISTVTKIVSNALQTAFPGGPLNLGVILEKRYKITDLIDFGGMGAIYKVLDLKLDTVRAMKELLPAYGSSPDKQAREWFKREANLLATLDHPGLPKVSDYFIKNDRYYLVMNFIEGKDLETIMEKYGTPGLPPGRVVQWAKQILQILDYLHNQTPPVIYRDLKPSNIMLNKDGRVTLIDFGIARIINKKTGSKKTAIGTDGYSPLEQYEGNAELRSDIYALGATMHNLITGIDPVPFKFKPLKEYIKSITPELDQIIMKALEEDLSKRFSSAMEMLEALNFQLGLSEEEDKFCGYLSDDKTDTGEKKYEEILQGFDLSIEKNPASPELWVGKGQVLTFHKDYEESIKCFDRALEIEPTFFPAWLSKGESLYYNEKYKEALECFNKAIEYNPEYDISWYYKGRTLFELKNYEEAISCFLKAIELDPEYVMAWNFTGKAFYELGNYKEALYNFEKALELNQELEEAISYKEKLLSPLEAGNKNSE